MIKGSCREMPPTQALEKLETIGLRYRPNLQKSRNYEEGEQVNPKGRLIRDLVYL